ncbi:hypothetical protein SIDU_03180 [Sphingobium indicum B90A]|nr:DUF2336 domain-containing protein [Sphingobium indicum]APL96208.1 hypothetical protein SIDU_03180 [Sphingobium indicum B90A]NYI21795.1 hypothetical protein [Sphingobium indicum]
MSAYSSLIGSTRADCWPMAQVMAGMSAVPVGHAIDLAFFFPDDGRERHDALVAETRRHLGGCLTAMEIGLRLALEETREIAAALAQWPQPVCWPTLRAQPTLLGPALLAHMQMRGGISLMLRQFGGPDGGSGESEADSLFPADDPALGEALAALMLAEGRWLLTAAEDQPMQPDLPAGFFAELLWTAAACLAAIVQRSGLSEAESVVPLVEAAAQRQLARHDEATGPIAAADRLVGRLGDRADAPEIMAAALQHRHFLLFAALAGRRLRMESAQVADILVMGPVGQVAALCRALGGSDSDYRQLLLALRPVRPSLSDATIVGEAMRYQELSVAQADAAVGALRAPAALRAKLDHLRRIAG